MRKTINKFFLSVFLVALFGLSARAQHHYEIGANLNVYGVLGAIGSPATHPGPGVFFEYRYDVADNFDIGAQVNYKYGQRLFKGHVISVDEDFMVRDNMGAIKILADYNICPGRLACPYLGIGAGVGTQRRSREGASTVNTVYGVLAPRVGVQIWHFRVAVEMDLAFGSSGFNRPERATALSLSYSF